MILASGLDTRAYRLPWPAGTVVFEIDQPEVIEFKTRTLADLGAEPTAERRTVAIDLRDDWPAALRDGGFRPQRSRRRGAPRACWSTCRPRRRTGLFDNITALSAPGSRIATEHMDMAACPTTGPRSSPSAPSASAPSINLAELFYTGERNSAADYLATHGWQIDIRTTAEAYAANGFELPDDELAAFGGDSGYLTATFEVEE